MADGSSLALDPRRGEQLTLASYRREFRKDDMAAVGRDSWKFERQQHFEQPESPSWQAFHRGDWPEALRLLEERRGFWDRVAKEDMARGSVFHRVRVVEEPPAPYLQWELHSLRIQHECGMPVRIVQGREVAPFESEGPLPEIVVLGGQVLYEVRYSDSGALEGGVRYTDGSSVEAWECFTRELFEKGEDITSYMDRYAGRLPAPNTRPE
jgi:hypothetical protein